MLKLKPFLDLAIKRLTYDRVLASIASLKEVHMVLKEKEKEKETEKC
jgi:hypothetical protein